MIPQPRNIVVSLDGLPDASMKVNGVSSDAVRSFAVSVEPDEATTLKVYVTLPGDQVAWESEHFRFTVKDADGHEENSYKAVFNGPGVKKK